jgi:hypothetical protein
MLLLKLFTLFLCLLCSLASTTSPLSNVQYVTPRISQDSTSIFIFLMYNNDKYTLQFFPNQELYAANYQETVNHDFKVVLDSPPLSHCHYHVSLGDLPNHPEVHGTISTCIGNNVDDNVDVLPIGLISFSGDIVSLELISNLPQSILTDHQRRLTEHTHALIKLSDINMPQSIFIPFQFNMTEKTVIKKRKLDGNTKWVEMLVVNDRRRFDAKGDQTQVETAAIVNAINNLYHNANFDPPIRVVLSAQHTFTAVEDPWEQKLNSNTAADVNILINEFHEWRSGSVQSKSLPDHDTGHLFSSRDFDGSTVGYAGVGTMCLPSSSGGIDQMTFSPAYNAGIVAHEMGHTFDMSHDSNDCENKHVMSSSASAGNSPTTWSSCSSNFIKNFFTNSPEQLECLNNKPTSQWGDPICGNGFVENGEECDPIGTDACCDATTCKFKNGAVCSDVDASTCCKNCQFVPAALKKVCRKAVDTSCDIPEYCTGDSALCPLDRYTYPGAHCVHPTLKIVGACYATQCKVYREQCKRVFQPALKWSNAFQCMNNKINDDRCGRLECSSSQGCQSATYMSQDGTPIGVDDGTPCAIDHETKYGEDTVTQPQCKAGKCVDSGELAPTSVCGNGVTESGEECDCGQANDPCCVCSTCKFKPGATCSNCSPCCDQCKPIEASKNKICRDRVGPCDIIEMCDGISGVCPPDKQKDSPSECKDNNNLVGSCQVDGTCKTLEDVCESQMGSNYRNCLASEADGKVDECGKLLCIKKSAVAQATCSIITATTPADATVGLPCTSPLGGNFGVCNFVKQCKAPATVVPQTPKPTVFACSGIGTHGKGEPFLYCVGSSSDATDIFIPLLPFF